MGGSLDDDAVEGGVGDDMLGGGEGADLLSGGAGNDQLGGGLGADMVDGGAGDDFVAGGGGNDMLSGGMGDDTLNGGSGDDEMMGGDGADVFVFNSFSAAEIDTIADFDSANDMLQLRGVEGGFDSLTIIESTDGDMISTDVSYQGHTISLLDVEASTLDSSDFLFV